jgi:hypothetical protein
LIETGKDILKKRNIDKRADIYSIGRLLLYLLLERSPGLALEMDPASKLVKEPQGLVEVVRMATQHDRTKRYADVGEMMRALERCMGWSARVDAYLNHTRRTVRRHWPLVTVTGCLMGGLVGGLSYQTIQAEEQRTLKEQAERARQEAVKAVAEAKVLRESLTSVSEQLDQNMGEYCESATRKVKLESGLVFKRKRLAELPKGSIDANKLVVEIRRDEDDLLGFEKRIAGLERSQVALRAKLKLVKNADTNEQSIRPEAVGTAPFNAASSCSQRAHCENKGLCSFDGTICVASSDDDCRQSIECGAFGHCTATGGHCLAGTDKDCKKSTACGTSGLCSLSGQSCIAAKDADCTGKSGCVKDGACTAVQGECRVSRPTDCAKCDRCTIHGECTAKDGQCYPGSDADCRQSTICDQRGLCFTDGLDCIAKLGRDCRESDYCESFGQCTLQGEKCR